jgi:hypothetical protein
LLFSAAQITLGLTKAHSLHASGLSSLMANPWE